MPDTVEENIRRILKGLPLEDEESVVCDFSLAEQNAAMEAQGISPTANSDHRPVLGETITYIVAAVLLNEQDEVLMIQEAKQSCAGKWYLPAGRVEKGDFYSETFLFTCTYYFKVLYRFSCHDFVI